MPKKAVTHDFISKKEFIKLITHPLIPFRFKLFYRLVYYPLLTLDETINLKPINFERENTITLEETTIPICPHLYQDVWLYINYHEIKKNEYIFHSRFGKGTPMNKMTLIKNLKKHSTKILNKRNVTTYSLRLCRYIDLYHQGKSVEEIAKLARSNNRQFCLRLKKKISQFSPHLYSIKKIINIKEGD